MSYRPGHFRSVWVRLLLSTAVSSAVPCFAQNAASQPATRADNSVLAVPEFSDDQLKPDAINATIQKVLVTSGDLAPLKQTLIRRIAADDRYAPSLLQAALEDGDLPLAQKTLAQCLSKNPSDPTIQAAHVAVQQWVGNESAAIETLKKMIASADAAKRGPLQLKLAALALDAHEMDVASDTLRAAVASGVPADQAALTAALYGQVKLGADLIANAPDAELTLQQSLLRGTLLLNAGKAEQAGALFHRALEKAVAPRDRQFLFDRIAACARARGGLAKLADAALADDHLPADRLMPLISTLRELGRIDDILLLVAKPRSEAHAAMLRNPVIQKEIIAAIVENGHIAEARDMYRNLMAQDPKSSDWRLGLARLEIDDDHPEVADKLLSELMEGADGSSLLYLARQAHALGRDEVAAAAATRAMSFRKSDQLDSLLFRAQLARLQGQASDADEYLKQAAMLAGDEPTQMLAIADAFEQAGNRVRAIGVLKSIINKPNTESILPRLAWLLEQENDLAGARDLWQRAWRSATVAARKTEARDRLLDLSSRTGSIADLVLQLEDQLAAGKADRADLSLMVEIYARMRDAASAAEVLQNYRSLAGSELDVLEQLSKIYVQCERFGQADRVLRRMIELDPANAVDLYQQLAVVAIERKRPDDALRALRKIDELTGTDRSAATLRAGVFDQLGMGSRAANEYRRGLAADPEQMEEWLLWAQASTEDHRRDQAIARLQLLAENAANDELFVIAIDGLLNLSAPPPALRAARRSVILRLSAHPERLSMYNVASDLSEALTDPSSSFYVQELAVLVGGEQRTALLRDLILAARAAGQTDAATAYGSTLVSLGEQVPPEVFLDLGEQLLKEKRDREADRAFGRARDITGNEPAIILQISDLYKKSGHYDSALRVLRDLARLNPNDLELQLQIAGLCEQIGQFEAACRGYENILNLLIRKQSITKVSAAPVAGSTTSRDRRQRPTAASSVGEFQRLFDPSLDGYLVSARSSELKAHALELSRQWLADALAQAPDVKQLSDAPRLDFAALIHRRLAFAFQSLDAADTVDRQLLARFPEDRVLASALIQDRISWGYTERAAKFAQAQGSLPDALAMQALLESAPKETHALVDKPASWLPRLLLLNRPADARAMLQRLLADGSKPESEQLPTLLAAAVALDDRASAKLVLDRILTVAESSQDKVDTDALLNALKVMWPRQDQSEKNSTFSRLVRITARAGGADRTTLARACLRVAYSIDGLTLPDPILMAALDNATPQVALSVLRHAPAERQTESLDRIINATAPLRRRQLIMSLMGICDIPLNKGSKELLVRLFAASPSPRATGDERYAQLQMSRWNRNPDLAEQAVAIARMLQKDAADVSGGTALAAALQSAGKQDEAEREARRLLLATVGKKLLTRNDMLAATDAIKVLRVKARQDLLAELSQDENGVGLSSNQLLIRGMILQSMGHNNAVSDLTAAYELNPGAPEPRRILLDYLETQWRSAALVRALLPHVRDESIIKPPERSRLLRHLILLRRFTDAEVCIAQATGTAEGLQRLQVACECNRPDGVLYQLRSLLVDNRRERRFFTPFFIGANQLGGIADYREYYEIGSRRYSVFDTLAQTPAGRTEILALLTATVPGSTEISGLVSGLAASAKSSPERRALLKSSNLAGGELSIQQRALLLRLIGDDPAIAADMDDSTLQKILLAVAPEETGDLAVLAKAYAARGNTSQAEVLNRWNDVAKICLTPRGRGRALFSDAAALKNLVSPEPGPWDEIDEAAEVRRLNQLAAEQGVPAADAELQRLVQTGQINMLMSPRYLIVAAQLAAQRGDEKMFRDYLDRATGVIQRRSDRSVMNLAGALPPTGDIAHWSDLIRTIIMSARNDGDMTPPEAVREMSVLGAACVKRNDNDAARQCLDAANKLSTQYAEQHLWVADLARMLGDQDRAAECETELLRKHALPLARIRSLLTYVAQHRSQADADALAMIVAQDTDDPDVLSAAIRGARAQGGDVSALEKRLAAQRDLVK